MPKKASKPATQADLHAVKTDLQADIQAVKTELREEIQAVKTELREEIQAVKTELREEIQAVKMDLQAVKTELKSDIHRLEVKTDRMAIEIVKTQADVREMRATMATKQDIQRILDSIDFFAGKSADYGKTAVLHGSALTEVQVTIKDHESRIVALEPKA